jgi:four helix bundle protein
MRCGTSIGANAKEAEEGQTKPDFIAKLSISRKESREARFWLRLSIRTAIVTQNEVEWELRESGELLAMLRSAIRRDNRLRGEALPSHKPLAISHIHYS